MAIRSRKNQYIGVNAHLHSALQNEVGGWPIFRSTHVIDIARLLDTILPETYLAVAERSMQIHQFHPDSGERVIEMKAKATRPDISIYQRGTSSAHPATATMPPPTLHLHGDMPDDPAIYFTAVSIRKISPDTTLGQVVTWIELLSPTNKPPGDGYVQYIAKRRETLKAGIVLIELDYLHESHPIDTRIPAYPPHEMGAYPYLVALIDPRPTPDDVNTRVYGFRVDNPIPTLNVPLAEGDEVTIDFNHIYQQTFSGLRAYSQYVHYEQLPVNFETYDERDQQRIRARMQAVAEAVERGEDLEQGPFAIETE